MARDGDPTVGRAGVTRRDWLSVAGSVLGLSGCVSTGSNGDPPGEGTTDPYAGLPEDERPDEVFAPEDPQRELGIGAVDGVPEEADITLVPEVRNAVVTGEEPGRIAVRTTNQRDPGFVSHGAECGLFGGGFGRSNDRALMLFEPRMEAVGSYFLVEEDPFRVEPLWATRHPEDGSTPIYQQPMTPCFVAGGPFDYDPGTTVTNEYWVWDGFEGSGYMPRGTHRFENRVEVRTIGRSTREQREPGETLAEFTWGFELEVSEP